jgi:hypothetical protein
LSYSGNWFIRAPQAKESENNDIIMLTKEQLSDFERDGFLIVKGLYQEDEMRYITAWTEEVTSYPPDCERDADKQYVFRV